MGAFGTSSATSSAVLNSLLPRTNGLRKNTPNKANFANWIWNDLGVAENADAPVVCPSDYMIHDDYITSLFGAVYKMSVPD